VTNDSTQTPEAVTAGFHEFLNDAAASYGALTCGLGLMRRTVEQFAELTNMGPGGVWHMGTGDMPTERPSDAFGVWTRRRIAESCGPDGAVVRQLGHWWVSHVYAMWEHGFRPRLAEARGVGLDDVTDPLMGDLRRLRHDVLHHRGIATAGQTGRCERLRWFTPGEDMFITSRMIYEFMAGFGLAHPAP
jgi:hypothetical protein